MEPVSERANGIVVRRADSNDADARLLAALGARLFEDAFGAMNDPNDLRLFLARTYSPDLQLAELRDANRATWIAEANHEAVGYAMARRGSASPRVVARHPAEVQRIYAGRAWHGRGVGGALLKACVEQARAWGCDVLWLGVWEQNPRGIAFYEKWGFRRMGEQRFLVGTDSQRDHVMSFGLA
ncbi:MAG TPA: GNAT family N-acetyltransferase [Gemmatimonadaceae bacterium]